MDGNNFGNNYDKSGNNGNGQDNGQVNGYQQPAGQYNNYQDNTGNNMYYQAPPNNGMENKGNRLQALCLVSLQYVPAAATVSRELFLV